MQVLPTVRIALRGLRVNKMRSALTMLGIIIGVGAVITMLGVGEGARASLAEAVKSLGTNLILIVPGSTTSGGARMGSGNVTTLVLDDALAIEAECPSVEAAAPVVRGTAQVIYRERNWSTSVLGTTESYQEARDWRVSRGRFITGQDVDGRTKNCLIGETTAEELFSGEDPVGRVIRVKKVPFTVVGVLERKGQSPMGQDQDDVVIVPVTTAQSRLFGITHLNAIMASARGGSLARAVDEIQALLHQRHRIAEGEDDDFSIRNLTEMLAAAEAQARVMTVLLGSVASVSLLVGGIGIMNIMLVSVTERTREIGIRMAVGAKPSDILMQFLVEASVLSLIGGLTGIVLGVAFSYGISMLSQQFETVITVPAVLLAFGFSAAVGVFFGYYPASKAAKLDPIAALRYE